MLRVKLGRRTERRRSRGEEDEEMKVVAVMVLHMILVLQQVMLQVLNKVDKRRRSLPMVLVHLVETAPSSPQSLSRLSLDSQAKVLFVWCAS